MSQTPEQEITENNLLKEEWRAWNELLKSKGKPGEEDSSIDLEYEFLIDRKSETESLFTGDSVVVQQVEGPLEVYTNVPKNLRSGQDEIWIEISIDPRNPYLPMLGVYTQRHDNFYFNDRLLIYISNLGRSFQTVDWSGTLTPDIHVIQSPAFSYLKSYPAAEEVQILDKEPEPVMDFLEPPQALKGESWERLDFLKMKLQKGEIIEP